VRKRSDTTRLTTLEHINNESDVCDRYTAEHERIRRRHYPERSTLIRFAHIPSVTDDPIKDRQRWYKGWEGRDDCKDEEPFDGPDRVYESDRSHRRHANDVTDFGGSPRHEKRWDLHNRIVSRYLSEDVCKSKRLGVVPLGCVMRTIQTIQPKAGTQVRSCHQPDMFASWSRRVPTAIPGRISARFTRMTAIPRIVTARDWSCAAWATGPYRVIAVATKRMERTCPYQNSGRAARP
jgi:hypothetical protein